MDLAVLFLRVEHKNQLRRTHPDVERLAAAMGRTESSIWMRKGNFDYLDPEVPGVALSNVAKMTEQVWAEYDETRIASSSRLGKPTWNLRGPKHNQHQSEDQRQCSPEDHGYLVHSIRANPSPTGGE